MSVGRVSTYALSVLRVLCITGLVPCRSTRFDLTLLFGYIPVLLHMFVLGVLKTQMYSCACLQILYTTVT